MATLLQSDSRRKYSWWWDSHNPKNSKWLQDNLTDMDAKVKAMIKLIEEDADSFARRAEMYYKKRPELMKLVEEFYRAYRALAERYDHLTGELRHAQKAMAEAFPNQVPFFFCEDSPSRSSEREQEPQTPDVLHPLRASTLSPIDQIRGLKQIHEMLGVEERAVDDKTDEDEGQRLHAEVLQLSNENDSLKVKANSESERAAKAESEVQKLQAALEYMKTEKESLFLQYQLCMEKLSNLDAQLVDAQKDFMRLNDQAIRAEIEVESLKEALTRAQVEKDDALIKNEKSMEKISNLEGTISHAQDDLLGLSRRAVQAETEALKLNLELSRLESEKAAEHRNYKDCLANISHLENKLSLAEEHAQVSKDQADQAQGEVERLRKALAEVNQDKESSGFQYQECLKRIAELERELSCAREDVKRLSAEISTAATKLKHSENKCGLLEMSNQSLRLEAENLMKKIARKDKELSEKQTELESLQVCMQDEQSRYAQIEAMLQSLQNSHSQSQEEHKLLAEELKSGLQTMKDLEVSKHELEDELRQVKDENACLNELKSSSNISMENLQNEIVYLRSMKEKLEGDVAQQIGQSNSLQKEITSLKEEIEGLNSRYQALLDQLKALGLNPDCIGFSVRNLQDENVKLRQLCDKENNEKGALYKKLENLEELSKTKHVLQGSLSDLNIELEASREKVREMEEMCQFARGEKSILISEKAALLSQLQGLTENMQKILEKNAVLENSLSGANIELEGLREKSKGLEEICKLLKNEKSNLQAERGHLALQLANVESRLEYVEKKCSGLEEKYAHLEKEKQSMHSEMNELRISLVVEKQERTTSILQRESRLVGLEHHLQFLQEESRWRKKEFEDELDKAVKAQCEIFILQKFVEDMEQKNYSLLIDCQRQVEASKLAEKLITELENENLEQQVEAELLLDEIEKLRLGIYRVFKALEVSPDNVFEDKVENEQIFLQRITGKIEEMKHSLSRSKEDEQLLSVENTVLLTLLRQLKVEGTEIELQKEFLEEELKDTNNKFVMVRTEKHELTEMNSSLESQVSQQNEQIETLKEEVNCLHANQSKQEKCYLELQVKYSQVLEENRYLFRKFSELKEEKFMLEQQSDVLIQETLVLSNISTVFKNYGAEKALELKLLHENLKDLNGNKEELENEVVLLKRNLELKEAENMLLKDSVQRLEMELHEVRQSNDDLKQEIVVAKDAWTQKEAEVLEVEQKFRAADHLNLELGETVDALKAENQESLFMRQNLEKQLLTLSEDNRLQEKEVNNLRQVNENLVTELCKLHEECEEQRIREEKLSSELKEKNNEFELWEAEAAAFYFDLQLSSIRGVLYENKVHELAKVCGSLEDDSASKTLAIEQMKDNITSMENEIGGLRAQLSAYGPIMASLREDVASLEHNVLRQKKLIAIDWAEPKWSDFGIDLGESFHDKQMDDQSPNTIGIEELQKLQRRIKAVEKVMAEDTKRLVLLNEKKDVKLRRSFSRRKSKLKEKKVSARSVSDDLKLLEDKSEVSSNGKKGALMKDIPLDHVSDTSVKGLQSKSTVKKERKDDKMLELWETAESRSLDRAASISRNLVFAANEGDIVYDHIDILRQKAEHPSTSSEVEKELSIDKLELSTSLKESDREMNSRRILERLTSDAQKLTNLHLTVQNLRRKLDTSKKSRKSKDVDLETVKEQLQEVQETVVQLVDLNGQLMKNIEENPSPSSSSVKDSGEQLNLKDAEKLKRKTISEQARKGSEKIGRLQLEVQKLQYVLLKMEDEQKNRGKSRTTIILRDFIYSRRKDDSGIKKKSQLCCFRPTTPNTPSPSARMYYN